jgi:hypothetical protein
MRSDEHPARLQFGYVGIATRTGLCSADLQFRDDDVTYASMFILRTAVFGWRLCLRRTVPCQHPPPGNTNIPRVPEEVCHCRTAVAQSGCVRNVPTGSLTAVVRCRIAGGILARQIASLQRWRRPPKSHHDPHTTTTTTETDQRDCY